MPYTLTMENGLVDLRFTGIVSAQDCLDADKEMHEAPNYEESRFGIVDFTAMEKMSITSEAIRQIAQDDLVHSSRIPDLRVAFIAATPIAVGFARMWQNLSMEGVWVSEIFETRAEAENWLYNT